MMNIKIGIPSRLGQSWTTNPWGSYGQNYSSPYGNVAPVPSAPPALLPSPAREIDSATRGELLEILKGARQQRANAGAWWAANKDAMPSAIDILGEKYAEYQKQLTIAEGYGELANTLEWRFDQSGPWYLKDVELKDLKAYQTAVGKLVGLIETKSAEPLPEVASGDQKDLVLTGGVAVGAFLLSALL